MSEERTYERKNRFNGESVMLTEKEAKIHDGIFLAEIMATLEDKKLGHGARKQGQSRRDGVEWGRKHKAKSYMVLLD